MKLMVIGATRGIGRNLVEQALEEGHVVAFLASDEAILYYRHEDSNIRPKATCRS